MKRFLFYFAFLFLPLTVFAQNRYDKLQRFLCTITKKTFVLDFEKLLNKEETEKITQLITNYEKETSIEIAVITLDAVFETNEDFSDYTLFLANYIGIGKKDLDNGILIGFSNASKKIRIENGNGIEKMLSDEETWAILNNEIIPSFKTNDFFQGIYNGITAIIEKLNSKLKQ